METDGLFLMGTELGSIYVGPWLPARGNFAVFTCEVLHELHADVKITIDVETKCYSQDDSERVSVGSSPQLMDDGPSFTTWRVGSSERETSQGFLELWRPCYRVTCLSDVPIADRDNPVLEIAGIFFRLYEPCWFENRFAYPGPESDSCGCAGSCDSCSSGIPWISGDTMTRESCGCG